MMKIHRAERPCRDGAHEKSAAAKGYLTADQDRYHLLPSAQYKMATDADAPQTPYTPPKDHPLDDGSCQTILEIQQPTQSGN
ncbi:MAG: hypothetical protein LBD43_02075, partial [Holosporales bacterium]|nr:hypothetical protein [Holosporales bacterium]